ncbi:MAG: PIN domain-containing protein [Nitrospirota bacterium]
MLAVDTGPLVAILDKSDDKHNICVEAFKLIQETLITTWPVITEAFHLLGFSYAVQDDLWEFIERGTISVYNLNKDLAIECRRLMKQYHDLPMDFADASLVAVANAENITTIFTLDEDFKVYRTKKNKRFKLLPGI